MPARWQLNKETLMIISNLRIGITLSAALIFSAFQAIAQDVSPELQKVREIVSGKFAGINPQDIFASEVDGWYTVRQGAIIAYVSSDGRYLLQGDLIDLENSVNLSEESRNEARAVMMSEISDDQVILFTPEDVRHSISVFTDIDCTYCRRLHSQIDEYLAEGIEIRYFLYPRSGPDSPSWTKAEEVWCADDQNSALTLAKLDQKFDTDDCDTSIIDTHYSMGQDVGLRGTPAIVLEDGTLFSGYLPPKQLSEAIASAAGE
jgi:thiol:disulfide interchange protein DsbC